MLYLRVLHQDVLAVLLILTSSGFSDISTYESTFKNPQTEIIVSKDINDETTAQYCNVKDHNKQQVTVNHYTVFNFKSLLSWCELNFRLTIITQKHATFQFLDTNSILKQNLIAYKYNSPTHPSFVK